MIDSELLKILCCPETHQEVRLADSALVEKLNQQIAADTVRNRAGKTVTEKVDGGLVRADGKFLYPIRQGIPVMLIDEAIPLTLLPHGKMTPCGFISFQTGEALACAQSPPPALGFGWPFLAQRSASRQAWRC